jgi:hypothetical protein
MLTDSNHVGWQPGPVRWSARARNMTEQRGIVEVTLLPGPPS